MYSICTDISAETESSSSSPRRDTSTGPIHSVTDLSGTHGEISPIVRSSRQHRRQRAAGDRHRLTLLVTTVPATMGNGLLKEEPVQFPVTFHTTAAYFATTIKLYATFSMYFRVRCFKMLCNIITTCSAPALQNIFCDLHVCLSKCHCVLCLLVHICIINVTFKIVNARTNHSKSACFFSNNFLFIVLRYAPVCIVCTDNTSGFSSLIVNILYFGQYAVKSKLHLFDLMWICCTTSCTSRQQIEQVEFGL